MICFAKRTNKCFASLMTLLTLYLTTVSSSEWGSTSHVQLVINESHNYFDAVLNLDRYTFVGAKNQVLVIDRSNGSTKEISLSPEKKFLDLCRTFHPNELILCSNVIKLIEKYNSSSLLVCGTNVLRPNCHIVDTTTLTSTMITSPVDNYIPQKPYNRVPATIVNTDRGSEVYDALCQKSKCSIYRFLGSQILSIADKNSFSASPTFINMYSTDEDEQKVYLFFRDTSDIFLEEGFTKNGKTDEYGLVARVCQSDRGGQLSYTNNFMTFMRARLLCPYSNSSSGVSNVLFYNSLRSTFKIGNVVYGLFTLPSSWNFKASAICAFDIETINRHIDGRAYANNNTLYYSPTANNLVAPYPAITPPLFLPGQCPGRQQSTRNVNAEFVQFVSKHSLVATPVRPLGGAPLHIAMSKNYDFLLVQSAGDYRIFYLFKARGFMRKVRITVATNEDRLLGELQVFNEGTIQSVSMENQTIMVVTETLVYQLSPAACSNYKDCGRCEADPHCNWQLNSDQMYSCGRSSSGDNSVGTCFPEPAAPRDVVVEGTYPSLTLRWRNGSGEVPDTGYWCEIRRKANEDLVLRRFLTVPHLQIEPSLLEEGTNYVTSIRAVNNNTLSALPTLHEFATSYQRPNLKVRDVDQYAATLAWNSPDSARSYNITIYTYPRVQVMNSYIVARIPRGGDLEQTFFVNGLSSGHQYKVLLTATSSDNVESAPDQQWINTTVPTTTTTTTTVATTTTTTTIPTTITTTTPLLTLITTRPSTFTPSPTYDTSTKEVNPTSQEDRVGASSKPLSLKPPQTTPIATVTSARNTSVVKETEITKATITSRQSDISRADTYSSKLMLILVIFAVIAVFFIVVVAHNLYCMGRKTKVLYTGDDQSRKVWKRKCCLFWFPDKDRTSSCPMISSKNSSVTVFVDETHKDEKEPVNGSNSTGESVA